jgi:hypothetical protein
VNKTFINTQSAQGGVLIGLVLLEGLTETAAHGNMDDVATSQPMCVSPSLLIVRATI